MRLELENLRELMKLFKGNEHDYTIFVGQFNKVKDNIMTITVIASLKFTGFEGEDVISVSDVVGSEMIPPEAWKENPDYNQVFESRKAKFEQLETEVESLRKDWCEKLRKKGFNVFKGVWFE